MTQRVVLYDEDPGDPKGKQYVGSVIWRTEPVKASGNQKPDIAVRADIEIPDRKFKMTMSFRRNTDTSLPASHTAELTFILPQDFSGGGVGNVPGILMKSNEQARGTPLAGLAVKVTDGFFLVGLSNVDSDRARNLQLLKERSWFDVPLVYVNQRRAIIAIEKGAPGERAFNEAFAAWESNSPSASAPSATRGRAQRKQLSRWQAYKKALAYCRRLRARRPAPADGERSRWRLSGSGLLAEERSRCAGLLPGAAEQVPECAGFPVASDQARRSRRKGRVLSRHGRSFRHPRRGLAICGA